MRLGIAADHGGFHLKEQLVVRLKSAGHEIMDFGAHELTPDDDYPDFVIPLGQAGAADTVDRGVAVCGSGVGASVCANKIKGVRACLIEDHFSAKQGVEDDNLNVILSGRTYRRSGTGVGFSPDVSRRQIHQRRSTRATAAQGGRAGDTKRLRKKRWGGNYD